MREGVEVTAQTSRSGLSLRVAAIGAVILLLVFGGVGAWALSTNADLDHTRQSLTTTSSDLAATKTTLADTQSKLRSTKANVSAEQSRITDDTSRITNLETQIDRKAACITVQTANLTELRRILALERANFARSTSGSAWAKENAAAYKAIGLAIDYLYKAYTSAAAGSYGTANVWLSRSNAQVSVSNKQVKLANAEIKKINAASDAINKANDAFAETLDKTASTCGS
jgi:peptidoglycan hydrolase CwlO-like protein